MIRLIVLFLILCNLCAFAEEEKELAYGAGVLNLSLNHYRGSDQSKFYTIPFPYFYYKSERVEAEPSYFHGIFYKNELFSLRLSVIAGLKVDSEDNIAREGMPNLGYTFEVGPMFFSTLWKSSDSQYRLDFAVPFRQVFSTDITSYVHHVGSFWIPFMNFIIMPSKATLGTRHEVSIAAMFGSRGYHRYYYEVKPEFAKPGRPEYDPTGGYTGFDFMWLMEKKFRHFSIVPFIRFDGLYGAAYTDSPLVKTKTYWTFAIMTNYLI